MTEERKHFLKVWHNGVDWVIAESEEDARAVLREQYGVEDAEEVGGFETWHTLDMAEDFTVSLDIDNLSERAAEWVPSVSVLTATARVHDWIASVGRGFLASTEW